MQRLKLKDDVDLKDLLKRFAENENTYDLDDPIFDEFISVNKITKSISHYGYNGLIYN